MRPKIVQLELNDLPDSHTATEKYIAELEEIVNAVANIGIDWGYGKYQMLPTDQNVGKARKLVGSFIYENT